MLGLNIAYLWTKFDHYSFGRSGDMVDAHQNLTGSCDLTIPLSGIICQAWASICYDQPICQIWTLLPPTMEIGDTGTPVGVHWRRTAGRIIHTWCLSEPVSRVCS